MKEYIFAQHIYKTLKCERFLNYHLIYLQRDVLLLADFLEMFRTTCVNYYGLDAANYITAPGLSWDAMLLKTKLRIEHTDLISLLLVFNTFT